MEHTRLKPQDGGCNPQGITEVYHWNKEQPKTFNKNQDKVYSGVQPQDTLALAPRWPKVLLLAFLVTLLH